MTRDNTRQAFHPVHPAEPISAETIEESDPAQNLLHDFRGSYDSWDDEPTERLILDETPENLGSYTQTAGEPESASHQLLARVRRRAAQDTALSDFTENYESFQPHMSPADSAQSSHDKHQGSSRTTHIIAQRDNIPEELIQDEWDEWETPAKTRSFRWKIPPYAVFVLALGVLGIILWGVLGFTPTPQASEETTASTQVAAPGASASVPPSATPTDASAQHQAPSKNGTIRVHVAGAVKNPGVQTLPADARAVDALEAAGGATPEADLNRVNLAGNLSDGTQLYIPRTGETAAPTLAAPAGGSASPSGASGTPQNSASPKTSAGSGQQAAPGSPINLNTASAEQLQTLPRIGPSLAARIISWRDAHGGFKSVDELDAVPGIGPSLMSSLRPLVTV